VLAWGNKEYLLRAFSFDPVHVAESWQTNLLTRLALFPAFALVVLLLAWSPIQAWLLVLWTLGLVICQSFEVLIVYRRAFLVSIGVELGSISLLLTGITALGNGLSLDALLFLFAATTLGKAGVLGVTSSPSPDVPGRATSIWPTLAPLCHSSYLDSAVCCSPALISTV
jgi:hypothetical protein